MTSSKKILNSEKQNPHQSQFINFPQVLDNRGNLAFIEGNVHVPFEIKRVYYLFDIPGGATRGGRAHKELDEVIIALSGSFDVLLDNGSKKETIHLNRSYQGLRTPPLTWRELSNFSSGSVCLALAGDYFKESDYIRDYDAFLAFIKG